MLIRSLGSDTIFFLRLIKFRKSTMSEIIWCAEQLKITIENETSRQLECGSQWRMRKLKRNTRMLTKFLREREHNHVERTISVIKKPRDGENSIEPHSRDRQRQRKANTVKASNCVELFIHDLN